MGYSQKELEKFQLYLDNPRNQSEILDNDSVDPKNQATLNNLDLTSFCYVFPDKGDWRLMIGRSSSYKKSMEI